jgi:hypothetical protein
MSSRVRAPTVIGHDVCGTVVPPLSLGPPRLPPRSNACIIMVIAGLDAATLIGVGPGSGYRAATRSTAPAGDRRVDVTALHLLGCSMPPRTRFDEPPEFDAGDRVVAVERIGPPWHRFPAGSRGIVVARTADRLIAALFDTGRVEHVHPAALRFEEPPPGEI